MFQCFQADDYFTLPLHMRIALGGGGAGAFQFQAHCAVIATAQLYDIGAKFAEQAPVFRPFGYCKAAGGHGVADSQPAGEGLAQRLGFVIAAIREFFAEADGGLAGFLEGEPVPVAALFPLG